MANNPMEIQPSREKLSITSGRVLLIDQFMLSNEKFLRLINANLEQGVSEFGGALVNLGNGIYPVLRDPYRKTMVLAHEELFEGGRGPDAEEIDRLLARHPEAEDVGGLRIDTRCVAMLDVSLLFDQALMESYQALREEQSFKEARDLLRSAGGAVRYGFDRYGDDLTIRQVMSQPLLIVSGQ